MQRFKTTCRKIPQLSKVQIMCATKILGLVHCFNNIVTIQYIFILPIFSSLFLQSFQDFQEKVLRLQQAIQCHNVLQKNETDTILFGRDNNDIDISTPQKIETNTSESNIENITWFEGPQKKSQPEQIHISTQSSYCT